MRSQIVRNSGPIFRFAVYSRMDCLGSMKNRVVPVQRTHGIFTRIRGEKHEEIAGCGFGSFRYRFIGLVGGLPAKWREDLTRKKRSERGERKWNCISPKT